MTITPSAASGNSVTVTVTNRSAAVVGCKMFGLPAGSVADSESRPPFSYVNPVDPRALIAPTPMPPGPCPDASCLPPDVADVVDDLWGEYTSP